MASNLTIQDIFQRYGYSVPGRLSPDMSKAAWRLQACRTPLMGHHLLYCPHGHYAEAVANSCKHRCCTQCSGSARNRWLDGWKNRLLECPHHHLVFTLPHEFNPLWGYNKRKFSGLLFHAATETLRELLADPKYLGARVGMLAALHTWSQTLATHVHVHVLVTAGGLDDDQRWVTPKLSCLLPRKVLMLKFRGKFRAFVLEALKAGQLKVPPDHSLRGWTGQLNRLGREVWNVKILERYANGDGVATYLAGYLKGGPISNSRLISDHRGVVRFRCRAAALGKSANESDQATPDAPSRGDTCRLDSGEFVRRFLEHVPPTGLQTVRGYGLYSGNQYSRLGEARAALGQSQPEHPESPPEHPESPPALPADEAEPPDEPNHCRCPVCGAAMERIHDTRRAASMLSRPPPGAGQRATLNSALSLA